VKRLILATAVVLVAASTAQAQSVFESMARRAAADLAVRAISAAGQGGGGGGGAVVERPRPAASEAPAPRALAASVASTGPSPWPNNLGDPKLRRPGQLKFDAALEDQKTAFKKFGEVSCNDCEGGVSFDTAANKFLNLRDMWAFDSALGALEVGQSLEWRARASVGRITVVSAEAVGSFPCKQLRWELTRGKETRTRDGLVCRGKSNPDADNDRWLEVF